MSNILIKVLSSNDQLIGIVESISFKIRYPKITMSVSRMRLDKSKFVDVFTGQQIHVAAQCYPVHIVIEQDNKEILRAHNVWLTGIQKTYMTTDWAISEVIELEAEHLDGEINY